MAARNTAEGRLAVVVHVLPVTIDEARQAAGAAGHAHSSISPLGTPGFGRSPYTRMLDSTQPLNVIMPLASACWAHISNLRRSSSEWSPDAAAERNRRARSRY